MNPIISLSFVPGTSLTALFPPAEYFPVYAETNFTRIQSLYLSTKGGRKILSFYRFKTQQEKPLSRSPNTYLLAVVILVVIDQTRFRLLQLTAIVIVNDVGKHLLIVPGFRLLRVQIDAVAKVLLHLHEMCRHWEREEKEETTNHKHLSIN